MHSELLTASFLLLNKLTRLSVVVQRLVNSISNLGHHIDSTNSKQNDSLMIQVHRMETYKKTQRISKKRNSRRKSKSKTWYETATLSLHG